MRKIVARTPSPEMQEKMKKAVRAVRDQKKTRKLSFQEYGPQIAYVRLAIEEGEAALPFC